jgi:hypothetical protein
MKNPPRNLSLLSLIALLGLEIFLTYDSLERQIALSLTNVLGVFLYLAVTRFFKRRGIFLPPWLWLLVAAGIWFDAVGNFAHLYTRYNWWDQLVHGIGPAMVGAIIVYIFRGFYERGLIKLPPAWHYFVVVSSAMFITVLYELTEYLGDILFNTHRITNLLDTADDLWWGLVAIIIVSLLLNRGPFSRKNSLTEK